MANDWFTAGLASGGQGQTDKGITDLNTLSNMAYHMAQQQHLQAGDQRLQQLAGAFADQNNPVAQSAMGATREGYPLFQALMQSGNVEQAMKLLPGHSVAGETLFEHNPYGARFMGGSYNTSPEAKRTVIAPGVPGGMFSIQGNTAKTSEQKLYEYAKQLPEEEQNRFLQFMHLFKQQTHISNVTPKDPNLLEYNLGLKEQQLRDKLFEQEYGPKPKIGIGGGTDYPTDPKTGSPMTPDRYNSIMNEIAGRVKTPSRGGGVTPTTGNWKSKIYGK